MQNSGSATRLFFYHTDFTNVGDGSPVPNEIVKNLRETERLPYDTSIKTLIIYNLQIHYVDISASQNRYIFTSFKFDMFTCVNPICYKSLFLCRKAHIEQNVYRV